MNGAPGWDLQQLLPPYISGRVLQPLLLSYLAVYLFCIGLSLGSLGILLLHPLTGGAWMRTVRRPLQAAVRTLPLQAVLALPLLWGMAALYPWVRSDGQWLRHKDWYLNAPFFLVRTLLYFAIWLSLAYALERRLAAWERSADPTDGARLRRLCAGGLLLFSLSVTFAAIDWVMTLTPHWYSSTFGLLIGVGWLLSAMALTTLCATVAARRDGPAIPPERWQDLGSLLMMFLLVWAYLDFMQYLTIWAGNLPKEIAWYLPRLQTSWRWLGLFLTLGGGVAPFVLLLFSRVKRDPTLLGFVAALLLVTQLGYAFWLTAPSFRPAGFVLYRTDIVALFIPGGLWTLVFLWQWRRSPASPSPVNDASLRPTHG